MNSALNTMNSALKSDEFCNSNDEFCGGARIRTAIGWATAKKKSETFLEKTDAVTFCNPTF